MIFHSPLISLLASASSQALSVPPPLPPAPQPEEAVAAPQPLPDGPQPRKEEVALAPATRPEHRSEKRELAATEPQSTPVEPVMVAAEPTPLLPSAPARPEGAPVVAVLAA